MYALVLQTVERSSPHLRAQLALGPGDFSDNKDERFRTVIAAAFAISNVGVSFVAGAAIYYAFKRGCFAGNRTTFRRSMRAVRRVVPSCIHAQLI